MIAQSIDCGEQRHGVSTRNDGQGYTELKVSASQNVLDSRMDLQRVYQCLTNDTWNEESCKAGAFYQENLSSLKQSIVWTLCESHEIRTASWLVTRWLVCGHHQCQSSKEGCCCIWIIWFSKKNFRLNLFLTTLIPDDGLLESKHEAAVSCWTHHKVVGSMPLELNSQNGESKAGSFQLTGPNASKQSSPCWPQNLTQQLNHGLMSIMNKTCFWLRIKIVQRSDLH